MNGKKETKQEEKNLNGKRSAVAEEDLAQVSGGSKVLITDEKEKNNQCFVDCQGILAENCAASGCPYGYK